MNFEFGLLSFYDFCGKSSPDFTSVQKSLETKSVMLMLFKKQGYSKGYQNCKNDPLW